MLLVLLDEQASAPGKHSVSSSTALFVQSLPSMLLCLHSTAAYTFVWTKPKVMDMLPQVNPDPVALDTLLNMGFNRDSATRALQQCHGDQAKAVDTLVSWGQAARAASSSGVRDAASGSGEVSGAAGSSVTGTNVSQPAADAASLLAQALQSSNPGTCIELSA